MCSARTDAGNAETRRTSVLLISAPFGLRSTRSKLCLLTSPSYLVETRTRFSESIAVLEAGFSDSGVALLLKRIFPYSLCIDRPRFQVTPSVPACFSPQPLSVEQIIGVRVPPSHCPFHCFVSTYHCFVFHGLGIRNRSRLIDMPNDIGVPLSLPVAPDNFAIV